MKVLVVTKSAWVEKNALGNTLSNFFGNWTGTEFYNIYCREELPQNNVCSGYFSITENQIVKNFYKPAMIGHEYTIEEIASKRRSEDYSRIEKQEKETLNFFRKRKSAGLYIAREIVWILGKWHNSKLDDFLDKNQIDIIFVFAADPIYLQNIANYCKRETGAKLMLFFADDTYSYKSKMPFRYLYQLLLRKAIKRSVNSATKVYGISQKLCDEYEKYFGRKIYLLNKGCSFEKYGAKSTISDPIKIVYAGNLLYGRWRTLGSLAYEIEKLNRDFTLVTLEVYTTTSETTEISKALNRGKSSKIMGARPYEEIKKILAGADIVLHVESFDKEAIKSTRLSFSTKIIDCMQSGSCMMAIGPAGIASMEYLMKADGAITITDLAAIRDACREVVQNPAIILQKAAALRRYAQAHHNITAVREGLQKDFTAIIAGVQQI